MDLNRLHEQISAIEAIVGHAARRQAVIRELDRLAEHLVGDTTPHVQAIKRRIQELVVHLVPERNEVVVYMEIYCR